MFGLDSVPVVASTPTTRDRVRDAAGLTAGSMATIGMRETRAKRLDRGAVAVLHATTIAFAPWRTRNSVIVIARSTTNAADRSP